MIKSFTDWRISESSQNLTNQQIWFLNAVIKGTFEYNKGLVDVHGYINMYESSRLYISIDKFPVKFGSIISDIRRTDEYGGFYSNDLTKLTTLIGAPQSVYGDFYCKSCTSLTTLEGAPQIVGRDFDCGDCTSLITLKGAPETVGGYFDCSNCTSLTSLMGAPFSVKGEFNFRGCLKIPKEEVELAEHRELREAWLKSGLSAKEFNIKRHGTVDGHKFGI